MAPPSGHHGEQCPHMVPLLLPGAQWRLTLPRTFMLQDWVLLSL